MTMVEAYEDRTRRGGDDAVREASRFLYGEGPVHQALAKIAGRFEALGIPYAVVGGMALNAHGYIRATVDVDVLVTPEGLKEAHRKLTGLGYLPPFAGSKQLRDTENGVKVEFLVTGGFPGDGKPKPVSFPDPSTAAVTVKGIRYVTLEKLLEMKLASGISNPGRLKDLGDVQEVIRTLGLGEDFAGRMDPYVRDMYLKLLDGVRKGGDQDA